jgi:phosphate transport system permease protein
VSTLSPLVRRRRLYDRIAKVLAVGSAAFGVFWLVWILGVTVYEGASAFGLHLFTRSTPAPGSDGGLLNAFVGSGIMVLLATLIGTPVGVLAGTWLANNETSRTANVVRFLNDVLLSLPSIVIGLFIYAVVVRPTGHFSGWAGALALMLILLPVVVRTSDEMLRLVPPAMREAALALGAPTWVVTTSIGWRAARAGILTGVLLGIARISGETAPLLFTALNNQFFSFDPAKAMANIPVVTFQFAMSPYKDWQALAWAGALVSTVTILIINVASRLILARGGSER